MSTRKLVCLVIVGVVFPGMLYAQGAALVLADGGIEFPDGTVQSTAATQIGYKNQIADFVPPLPYVEICFKGDGTGFLSDVDAVGGNSTQGGNCVPGDIGWVIELDERPSVATWDIAKADCLEDGMRLLEPFEWKISCKNDSALSIVNMDDGDWEWASNTTFHINQVLGGTGTHFFSGTIAGLNGCASFGWDTVGNSGGTEATQRYRCAR